MSRSYRKPIFKDGYGSRWKRKEKRYANSVVRRTECYDGGYYKRLYNSWNICDWIFDCRWSGERLGVPHWKMIQK